MMGEGESEVVGLGEVELWSPLKGVSFPDWISDST